MVSSTSENIIIISSDSEDDDLDDLFNMSMAEWDAYCQRMAASYE